MDEALKEKEKGAERIGDPKTEASNAYVAISSGLQEQIEIWIAARRQQKPYHTSIPADASDLLFPNEAGQPFRIGNYLKRILKPLAEKAGITDLTYQALRRTCATHFSVEGGPKAAQTQFRHTQLAMTGRYIKQIPEGGAKPSMRWTKSCAREPNRRDQFNAEKRSRPFLFVYHLCTWSGSLGRYLTDFVVRPR
jgi:integrase